MFRGATGSHLGFYEADEEGNGFNKPFELLAVGTAYALLTTRLYSILKLLASIQVVEF